MPEGLEVEIYRRSAAAAVGREVEFVTVDPNQVEADEIAMTLPGTSLTGADRFGKYLVLTFESAATDVGPERVDLGVHFGMSGRLVVDGQAAIDELIYSSNRLDPAWDRLVIGFTGTSGGGSIRVNDPRRWARFALEPALPAGVDLFDVSAEVLSSALATRSASVKSVLLNQDVVAGLGNMLVDEVLWESGIDPRRSARDLSPDEVHRLADAISTRLPPMLAAGGSHTGMLGPDQRSGLGSCPRCGAGLVKSIVGGRATVWCPDHQH